MPDHRELTTMQQTDWTQGERNNLRRLAGLPSSKYFGYKSADTYQKPHNREAAAETKRNRRLNNS
jgi:hypothetical protein